MPDFLSDGTAGGHAFGNTESQKFLSVLSLHDHKLVCADLVRQAHRPA